MLIIILVKIYKIVIEINKLIITFISKKNGFGKLDFNLGVLLIKIRSNICANVYIRVSNIRF